MKKHPSFRLRLLLTAVLIAEMQSVEAQELLLNGSFNQRDTFWSTKCGNIEAWGTEVTYGGSDGANRVAEIDDRNCMHQDVCVFEGQNYVFSMNATRRPGSSAPNPCTTRLKIEGLNAANTVVTTFVNMNIIRNNTSFNFTPVTGIPVVAVPAGSGVVKLRIGLEDNSPGYATYGMIIDALSLVPENRLPTDRYDIAGPDSLCLLESAGFSVPHVPTTASFRWEFGTDANPTNSTLAVPTVAWSTVGVKEVICIIGNGVCPPDTLKYYTQVLEGPQPVVTLDTLDCTTLAMSAGQPVPGRQYQWWFGDGQTGTGDSVVHRYKTSGPFSIVLRVTDASGCTAFDTVVTAMDGELSLNIGPDTTICLGDTLILRTAQPPGTHHLWSNGTSDSILRVISAGLYWVNVERNNCLRSDTIHISVPREPGVWLGSDTTICETNPLRIGSAFPNASYLWSTGSQDPYINVNPPGSYWLRVSNPACAASDTIHITAMLSPDIDLGGDGDICPEQIITLNASWPNSRYRWNTGDTTASITVTAAGMYQVAVRDEYGCKAEDSVLLQFHPLPEIILGPDTVVCEETPLVLNPWHFNADSLLWSDGSSGWKRSVDKGGIYIASAINKCGAKSDTIQIKQIFCDIMVPNAFTPNGDGKNDLLRVVGNIGKLEGFRFSIFNRWGEMIFQTTDRKQGWDGNYKGQPSQAGAYVYMLEYSLNGKPHLEKGNFHLIR